MQKKCGHRSGENLSGDVNDNRARAVVREGAFPFLSEGEKNAISAFPTSNRHVNEQLEHLALSKTFEKASDEPHLTIVRNKAQQGAVVVKIFLSHVSSSFWGVAPLSLSLL